MNGWLSDPIGAVVASLLAAWALGVVIHVIRRNRR